jgi:circadian clock protein KaiB
MSDVKHHKAQQDSVKDTSKPYFRFSLFVAGNEPNSRQARENLDRLCTDYFPGNNTVKIIDVLEDPQYALEKNIFITPALLLEDPKPGVTIFGNLRDTEKILSAFGLESVEL